MAGIYHNAELGIISMSSDGVNWLTIADKNLGATQVYNYGDTLSEANSGKYYQWGNNYGGPFEGAVTMGSQKVNTEGYGPGNYYSSSTYPMFQETPQSMITDWSSNQNDNLWGGQTNTYSAMKGPCLEGFHIPNYNNIQSLYNILDSLNVLGDSHQYLFMPLGGVRSVNNATVVGRGTYANVWSATASGTNAYTYRFWKENSSLNKIVDLTRVTMAPIRPFANEPITPDYTWTRLYGDELPAPKKTIKRFKNGGNYYYFGDAPVHASGVTLNKSSLTLTEVGQTEQLVATVTPSDAVEKSVTWTSSDTTVAMVARDGTITCIDPTGVCTITCTTNDGGYSAICKVPYEYEPNENTLAYRPLDSVNQLADLSGNNLDLGIISQDASRISFIDNYALFVKDSSGMYSPTFNLPNSFTVACWVYPLEPDAMSYNSIWNWKRGGSYWSEYYQLSVGFGGNPFAYYASLYGVTSIHNTFSSRPNGWLRIVCSFDYTSGVTAMYINGEKLGTSTGTKWNNNYDQIILGYGVEGAGYGHYLKIGSKLSNFIVEDKVWSDAEVLEDYNLTKGRYVS